MGKKKEMKIKFLLSSNSAFMSNSSQFIITLHMAFDAKICILWRKRRQIFVIERCNVRRSCR